VVQRNDLSHEEPVTVSSQGVHLALSVVGLGHGGLALGLLNCSSTRYDREHAVRIHLRDTLLTIERLERVLTNGVERIDFSALDRSLRPIRRLCVKLGRLRGARKLEHHFHSPPNESPMWNVDLDTMLQAIPFENQINLRGEHG